MDIYIRPSSFQTIGILLFAICAPIWSQLLDKNEGRIKMLDDHLLVNGEDITKERDMDRLNEHMQLLAQEAVMKGEDKEMVNYYLEVMGYIVKNGNMAIQKERNRLNGIISSTSSGHDTNDAELIYSLKRRNILEAFVDASAQYILGNMGLGDMPFGDNENIQVIDEMRAEKLMQELEEEENKKLNKKAEDEKKKKEKESNEKTKADKKDDTKDESSKKEKESDKKTKEDKKDKSSKKKDEKDNKKNKDKSEKQKSKKDSKNKKVTTSEKSGKKDSKDNVDSKKASDGGDEKLTKSGVPKIIRQKKKAPMIRQKDEI